MKAMTRPFVRAAGFAGILIALVALTTGTAPKADANSVTFQASVVEVKDGDTIIVVRNKTRLTVMLPGIEAPELDQPFGLDAKKLTTRLVKGRIVTIETFAATNPLVGSVRFDKNRTLAMELIMAGLAWTKSMDKFSPFSQAQEEAKRAKLGLWSDEEMEPIPPWEWRTGRRK
jgi:endonuclease YncB( thermonuclease family)